MIRVLTLVYRMLLRLRWGPLALLAVNTLLIVMILAVLASTSNISAYSTEEVVKNVPVHYIIGIRLTPLEGDGRVLVDLHRELVDMSKKLRIDIAENVSVITFIMSKELSKLREYAGTPSTPPQTPIAPPQTPTPPILGSVYGSMNGFNVVEGAIGPRSLGLSKIIVDRGLRDVVLGILGGLGVRFDDVYHFNCSLPAYTCPLAIIPPGALEDMISSESTSVMELQYYYLVNFSLKTFTILAPESIVEASQAYSEKVFNVLREFFGEDFVEGVSSRVFIVTAFKTIKFNYKDLNVQVHVSNVDHVLAGSLSAFSGASILVTAFLFSLTLPVIVTSWILARSVGELIAYSIRRSITLSLIRGLSLRSLTLGFLALSLTMSLIAIVVSILTLRVFIELTSHLVMGRAYYVPPLVDPVYILIALGIALSLIVLVYLKVKGVLRGYTDLTQASRLYVTVEGGVWKPSTSLTILFMLSMFKYILWITGVSSGDLVRRASEIHPILLVLAFFYAIIDFFVGFVAPVVVPYYVTSTLLSIEGFNRRVSRVVAGVISGSWGDLVSAATLRISPRFTTLTASIAITLSFVVASAIIRASILSWYDANSNALKARTDLGSVFFNVMALSMSFYSIIAFTLLSGFILVSSIIVGYSLFKGLERELAVLRIRGAPLRDLIIFTYPQVLTSVVVAILIAPLGIISAKGFIETFNSVFSGALVARQLTQPTLTIDATGLLVVVLAVLLCLLTPLILVTYMSRRLGVELVERV